MSRKVPIGLLIALVLLLLAASVLTACETASTPQPTAIPGSGTPVPTQGGTPEPPPSLGPYPTESPDMPYPTP